MAYGVWLSHSPANAGDAKTVLLPTWPATAPHAALSGRAAAADPVIPTMSEIANVRPMISFFIDFTSFQVDSASSLENVGVPWDVASTEKCHCTVNVL